MSEKKLHISTGTLAPENSVDLKIVYGVSCLSRNIVQDVKATVKNASIGGELKVYTELMMDGVKMAMDRIEERATEIGADGIYGLCIATPQVTGGAAELIIFGTAYKLKVGENDYADN